MKLLDLNPHYVDAGGEGITNSKTGEPVPARHGVGMSFDCPCGECGQRRHVFFNNPLDGNPYEHSHPKWQRTGELFSEMTLSPSILATPPHGCGWHGFIENGEIRHC